MHILTKTHQSTPAQYQRTGEPREDRKKLRWTRRPRVSPIPLTGTRERVPRSHNCVYEQQIARVPCTRPTIGVLVSPHAGVLVGRAHERDRRQSGRNGARAHARAVMSLLPCPGHRAWGWLLSKMSRACSASPGTFPTAEEGKEDSLYVSCDSDSSDGALRKRRSQNCRLCSQTIQSPTKSSDGWRR